MAQRRPDRTLGPGHDDFWIGCEQGELRLPRCESCGELAWPIVQSCECCGGEAFAWERLSGRGKIVSWCTFEHDYYNGLLPIPWETILVELDEGPLFISNPEGFGRREMRAGLPVSVSFADCEDSAGAFKLPIFKQA